MTISEILDQAKALSPQERKELAKLLIDTLDAGEPISQTKTGVEIVAMLQAMEPVEFIHPEIEDPVEWVKQIRHAQHQKRLGDWGKETEE